MSNLLNILESNEVPIENQQIIDYLQGQLTTDAQNKLEQQEQNDPMMKDAMEGLQMMPDTARLQKMTADMNLHLQQRIAEKKLKRKETARWKDQNWIIMSVITVILLIIICFVFIKRIKG
jgi:hypothetical protein